MRWAAAYLLAASLAAEIVPARIGMTMPEIAGLDPSKSSATVVVFVSTECPISNDYNDRMSALYREYSTRGVQFAFVNANVNESAAKIQKHAKDNEFPFAIVRDDGSKLADKLGAMATPESYVFDRNGALVYHGYIDDSRNPAVVRVRGLRDAVDALLAGRPIARPETRAFGCTIKRPR
jgi:thiol-disulfide isomerase/thioredoxin